MVKMNPSGCGKPGQFKAELIARCGLDCRLCHTFVRDRNTCPGCRSEGGFIFKSIDTCRIRNCEKTAGHAEDFCFSCDSYPCTRLKQLDKRYRTRYGVSLFENLESVRRDGTEAFAAQEDRRWRCPGCGAVLCMHKPQCLSCGHIWR